MIAHSAKVPMIWYDRITAKRVNRDNFALLEAINAAATANKDDFISIIGNTLTGGIPNNKLLTIGERMAVKSPTLKPNLYPAISVKKYIGSSEGPPKGNRWQSCGKRILPRTNNTEKR